MNPENQTTMENSIITPEILAPAAAGHAAATDLPALTRAMVEAIRDNRLDEAEAMLEELNEIAPFTKEFLVFPVLIAIQRGYVKEALQHLNSLGEDAAPELKALCLHILGDPSWHYYAQSCLESPRQDVRTAMRRLLEMPAEEQGSTSAS
ncbi:MAG TPA: HrpB1 family type III secretion system apparatus protein [Burkholderiaceae bacterium]|nr:HrpB1 family type III secretion system apparatus protein [Burkholderiaceae bacterium]